MTWPFTARYLGAGLWEAEGKSQQDLCDRLFEVGKRYRLVDLDQRTGQSHRHFFAALTEIWQSMPETHSDRYPTVDDLRRWCLIHTGFHDRQEIPCQTVVEAKRLAVIAKAVDPVSVVFVEGTVLVRLTAKSQSYAVMGREEFQRSKEAVLDYAAQLAGVDRAAAERQARGH